MNSESLQVRRIAIAYVFPGAPRLERRDNLAFYDEVTGTGVELPELQQLPQEVVMLHRKAPEYLLEVRVGALVGVPIQPAAAGGAPFRFLVAETGSGKPVKLFTDLADSCYHAFEKVWGARHGPTQMVEVSIISTLSFDAMGGARTFLRERVLRNSDALRNHLGREVNEFAFKFGSGMVVGSTASVPEPMANAQLDLVLETVPQDERLLVLNLTAKWHGVQIPVAELPEPVRASFEGRQILELNRKSRQPAAYVDETYEYLSKQVIAFLSDISR